MTVYESYIASAEWAAKRTARLALDGNRCRLCDEDGTRYGLEVHHRPSSYRNIPHESVQDDLVTVCTRCHDAITNAVREDRYGRRELPAPDVVTTTITLRKAVTHGLADLEVSVDILGPIDSAQRPDCRPAEQMGQIDEDDLWQKKEGRFRL